VALGAPDSSSKVPWWATVTADRLAVASAVILLTSAWSRASVEPIETVSGRPAHVSASPKVISAVFATLTEMTGRAATVAEARSSGEPSALTTLTTAAVAQSATAVPAIARRILLLSLGTHTVLPG
jgi:hypothetical protein